jgi:hypothetical protein
VASLSWITQKHIALLWFSFQYTNFQGSTMRVNINWNYVSGTGAICFKNGIRAVNEPNSS